MIRGIVNQEQAEWMVRMFQDEIKSHREWCEKGWISASTRDMEIVRITCQMGIPLKLLALNNFVSAEFF